MKKNIFNKYVDKVCETYDMKKEDLFTKDKRTDFAGARHLLYYLSIESPMQIAQLRRYMKDNGYDISHSSIYHGYNKVTDLVKDDKQISKIVKNIQQECTD